MIEAEVRGKLPELARAEDSLTSTFFGILKYSPMRPILGTFLGNATLYSDGRTRLRNRLSGLWPPSPDAVLRFWERHDGFGAPDILLIDDQAALVVEVKLDAQVSGEDQLRRYRELLDARFGEKQERHVVYLTKDVVTPALSTTVTEGLEDSLWWLSWYDLSAALGTLRREDGIAFELGRDVLRLLSHRELSIFSGFSVPPTVSSGAVFWEGTTPLMSDPGPRPVGRPTFWRNSAHEVR